MTPEWWKSLWPWPQSRLCCPWWWCRRSRCPGPRHEQENEETVSDSSSNLSSNSVSNPGPAQIFSGASYSKPVANVIKLFGHDLCYNWLNLSHDRQVFQVWSYVFKWAYPSRALFRRSSIEKDYNITAIFRLDWKGLPGTNTPVACIINLWRL